MNLKEVKMSKPTAVQWLENQLKERYSLMNSEPLFEQAKEMHREEIKDAVDSCGYQDESEYYYNETFGGEK